jgi:nicotinate-nucleotide pyrophosphorylase (carboxylating)
MAQRPHWLGEMVSPDIAVMLRAAGLETSDIIQLIVSAITEDLDGGVDVTTAATVPPTQQSRIELTARKSGVVAGAVVAAAVFDLVSSQAARIEIVTPDGMTVQPGEVIVRIVGPTHALLTSERSALNILCHLSGIATATAQWVKQLEGTNAHVRDTRKTTPGMRTLEKFAVRCGGGINHRMSLSDAALIKDNHVVAAGGVVPAFQAVRKKFPELPIEVEVDSLEQLAEVLDAGADVVLLDNFSVDHVKRAVEINEGRAKLEASGGLTLDVAREYAQTGVDYLAVGAITHSAPILDIGADLYEVPTHIGGE